MKTVPLLGMPLAVTDYSGAVEWVAHRALAADRAYAVEAANTHVVALARKDRAFGSAMARFDLIVPDGMPLVWIMNRRLPAPQRLHDRVYGPNLMLAMLGAGEGKADLRHFFLGGKESTLGKLRDTLATRYPAAQLAGFYSPPFGPWPDDEFDTIRAKIRDARANLVWVGLGCPKQEKWIAGHLDRLPPAVYFGIGAAFAFHAGEVAQAPVWMQKRGMEWLFRMAAEPRRLVKRYLVHNTLFLYYLLKDTSRLPSDQPRAPETR